MDVSWARFLQQLGHSLWELGWAKKRPCLPNITDLCMPWSLIIASDHKDAKRQVPIFVAPYLPTPLTPCSCKALPLQLSDFQGIYLKDWYPVLPILLPATGSNTLKTRTSKSNCIHILLKFTWDIFQDRPYISSQIPRNTKSTKTKSRRNRKGLPWWRSG